MTIPPKVPLSPALLRTLLWRHSLPFFLRRNAKRYGDLIQLREGVWLASHPDLARQILVANPGKWSKARGVEKTKRLLGEGLLGSHGELHRARRRLLQPLFAVARLPIYTQTILDCALQTRGAWRDGQTVDIGGEMSHLALSIVTRGVFGVGVPGREAKIARALDDAMGLFNVSMMPGGDWWEQLPPIDKKFRKARGDLDAIVYDLIETRRRDNRDNHLGDACIEGDDVLSILLRARDENGAALSDENIRDEAMTLLMAGHETTANALTFAFWLVGRHPQVGEQLAAEIDAVLGERRADYDDLPALQFTRAVLSEAMRLLPPAWIVGRRAVEDVTLDWHGDPTRVPRGTTILISPFIIGRDERFWPRARRFDPSRWQNGFEPERGTYFPFGAGSRACLAENFAWMEATLCLHARAKISFNPDRRFRFGAERDDATARAVVDEVTSDEIAAKKQQEFGCNYFGKRIQTFVAFVLFRGQNKPYFFSNSSGL